MRRISITGATLFVCFFASAQNNKNQLPVKPAEQNEIKADKHIEKEIQQKQLFDKPVLLEDKVSSAEVKKTVHKSIYKSKKSKSKRIEKVQN